MKTGPLADFPVHRIIPQSWEEWMEFRDALMTHEARPHMRYIPRIEAAFNLLNRRGMFDADFVARMGRLFDYYHERFTQSRKPRMPKVSGANLQGWSKQAVPMVRNATHYQVRESPNHDEHGYPIFARMIEPVDRVRSKGGTVTHIWGIPISPESDKRREVKSW